ncbi:MAG TPA: AAC(3) family N-acetyltransferase [Chloroflexota bacterium]
MTILVHSSLSSLGWVDGGAATVIDAIRDAIGSNGTILAPTLTGRQEYGPDCPPTFDPASSRTWTGQIPITLLAHPGARRSNHPTHSVAGIGPATELLIRRHEYCATPCAADSPYGRLADLGGMILLLGVTHDSNTSLHMIEEVAGVPYHLQLQRVAARVKREDGQWETIVTRLHQYGWKREFSKVEPMLIRCGAQRNGHIGKATSRLINVSEMVRSILPVVREDPLFLLTDAARRTFELSMGRSDSE